MSKNKMSLLEIAEAIVSSLGYSDSKKFFDNTESLAFEDMDGVKNLIFLNTRSYTRDEVCDICDIVYRTIFGSGSMCVNRTNMWKSRVRELGLPNTYIVADTVEVEITLLTVVSIMIAISPRWRYEYNIARIISMSSYWLDTAE